MTDGDVRFRALLSAAGLSQAQFIALIEARTGHRMTPANISHWVHGRQTSGPAYALACLVLELIAGTKS